MSFHRLTSVTTGVPGVEETALYYGDFGLNQSQEDRLQTRDGGQQLKAVHARRRGLVELGIGANDRDDLNRIAPLRHMNVNVSCKPPTLRAREPRTDVAVTHIVEGHRR